MFEIVDHIESNAVIKVIGVGGGGGNAVSHMLQNLIDGSRLFHIVASAAIGVKVIDYLEDHGCDVHEVTDELLKMFPFCKKEDIEFGPGGHFCKLVVHKETKKMQLMFFAYQGCAGLIGPNPATIAKRKKNCLPI